MSQAELGRRVGLDQSTINGLVRGTAQTSRHLHRIARALGTTSEYLSGETDDPGVSEERLPFKGFLPDRTDDDSVLIDQVDVSFGMGATFLDADVVPVEQVRFSRAYLRTFTDANPEYLFVARGIGDSMNPTIQDSDVVLVDRSQRVPQMHDRIWAMSFAGMGMIKRLRPRPDGAMRVLSDNPSVPEDLATDGELFVIGRVVAIVRKV